MYNCKLQAYRDKLLNSDNLDPDFFTEGKAWAVVASYVEIDLLCIPLTLPCRVSIAALISPFLFGTIFRKSVVQILFLTLATVFRSDNWAFIQSGLSSLSTSSKSGKPLQPSHKSSISDL